MDQARTEALAPQALAVEYPWPVPDPATALRFAILADVGKLARWQTVCISNLTTQGDRCVLRLNIVDRADAGRVGLGEAGYTSRSTVGLPLVGAPAQELDAILGRYEVDVLLDVRDKATPVRGIAAPRHGTWRLRFPSSPRRVGVTEVLNDEASISVSLEAVDAAGVSRHLAGGRCGVVQTSVGRTARRVLMTAATLPARAARAIRLGVPAQSKGETCEAPPEPARPGHLWRLRLASKLFIRKCKRAFQEAVTESAWGIGISRAPIDSFLTGIAANRVEWHPGAGPGRYLADPFAVAGDPVVIYAEEFNHVTQIGQLVSLSYSELTGWSGSRVALCESFHTSYPFLFEDGGVIYCVPETAWNDTVSIYRQQPSQRLDKVGDMLCQVLAGDPTIFRWGGHWWLFYTDCTEPRDTDLYVWYAASPFGPWHPHAQNPVKSDVSSARPGGTPFERDGMLFRPAQDDARTYGWRMVINQVVTLTPTSFEEVVVAELGPFDDGPFPLGPHTLSAAGPYTLIDGKRRVRSCSFRIARVIARMNRWTRPLRGREPSPAEPDPSAKGEFRGD